MNPIESIKTMIRKTWSKAPSMASRDLLSLYHTNPRLDGVRVIANKCASTELLQTSCKAPLFIAPLLLVTIRQRVPKEKKTLALFITQFSPL